MELKKNIVGKKFVKSTDEIKKFTDIVTGSSTVKEGRYQISDVIDDIESEYRGFVFENKLVGLKHYQGDFRIFPDVKLIEDMVKYYKPAAPVSYTIDVGISKSFGTFLIEIHDFFSCGLYGFSEHNLLPYMFSSWFQEFTKRK